MASVVVLTGQPGVGKSTVGDALARRFPRGAHVRADRLQRMIVTGAEWPSAGTPEARRQLIARTRNAAHVSAELRDVGITAVLDEVVSSPAQVEMIDAIVGRAHWILLVAAATTVLRRDAGRHKHTASSYLGIAPDLIHLLADRATILDTTDLDVDETVRLVMTAIDGPLFEPLT